MRENPLITSDSVILVSGGARGITARCLIDIANHYPCKFILLGRTPINDPLPEWTVNCPEDSELKLRVMKQLSMEGKITTPQAVGKLFRQVRAQQEVETTLIAIRATGSDAEYLNMDITAPFQDIQKGLIDPIQRLGEIKGLIHGAGSLADRKIENKTLRDFETVFFPKVHGLRNLLKVVSPEHLDFIILFSSVVGFFGNIGQADYAMANEVLNKTAYQIKRDHPNCHVVSIDWGPWDTGMVTSELKNLFMERNMAVIPAEVGTEWLVKELSSRDAENDQHVQILVGQLPTRGPSDISGELRKIEIHRRLNLEQNPFLLDHKIGSNPVLPATCAASWMISSCEQIYPGFTFFQLDDYKVLKGIVFDDSLSQEYILELKEMEKNQGEKIKCEARIRSKGRNGRPLYHYSMSITLLRKIPPTNILNVISQPAPDLNSAIPGKTLYEDGTLFHGPSFQGVQRVTAMGDDRLVLECSLSPIPPEQQGQFPLQTYNPFIYDAIVQSLLIWTQQHYKAPCLPSHLVRLEQYQSISFGALIHVDMKIISHNQTTAVADILVTNPQREIMAKFTGLQGTISSALNRFIKVDPLGNPGKK